MPKREAYEAVGMAMACAEEVLAASGHRIDGVVLLVELNGEGVTIAVSDDVPKDQLSTMLAEAAWRAAGAGG